MQSPLGGQPRSKSRVGHVQPSRPGRVRRTVQRERAERAPAEMPRRNPHETICRLDQRTHNARQEHNITCGRWWPPRRFNMTASNLIYDLPELGRQIKHRIQSCCDAVTIARAHRRLDIGVRIRPACVTRRDIRWPLIAGEVVEPLIEAAQHIRLHPERRVRHHAAGFEHDPLADVDVKTAGAKIRAACRHDEVVHRPVEHLVEQPVPQLEQDPCGVHRLKIGGDHAIHHPFGPRRIVQLPQVVAARTHCLDPAQ